MHDKSLSHLCLRDLITHVTPRKRQVLHFTQLFSQFPVVSSFLVRNILFFNTMLRNNSIVFIKMRERILQPHEGRHEIIVSHL